MIATPKTGSKCGEDMVVEASGLHLLPDKSFIGASSEGNVLCRNADTCSRGCLEIKCPYSVDHHTTISMTPTEIADTYPIFLCKREVMVCYMFHRTTLITHKFKVKWPCWV